MKVLYTFDGNDEKVVGLYWQDGVSVKAEIHDERGNFFKDHKNTDLKKMSQHLIHGYVDGYITEVPDLKIAKSYLGKATDILKKLPKSTL